MRFCLIVLFVLFSQCASAQLQGQLFIDSVLKRLPDAPEDTNKLKMLNVLSFAYKTVDPNEGIRYANQQLRLAITLNRKRAIASAYNLLGLNYQYKSDYPTALEYYHKSLLLYADNPKSGAYGNVLSNIGFIHQMQGDFDKALEYNLKSLEINKLMQDSLNMGGDYGNIGIIYLSKKDYQKALEYDLKSLEIFEQMGDLDGMAHNYGNIGNVYKELKNYTRALEYDMKALKVFEELGDNRGMAINLGNIGGVYMIIAKEMGAVEKSGKVMPAGSRDIFLGKAIEYLKKSIALSTKIDELDNIIEFSNGLSEAYAMAGNYSAALDYFRQYSDLKDSVYSQENKLQVQKLETERELALKDKQIQIDQLQVAQKRNERIILIIALVLVLIVTAIMIRKFLLQKEYTNQLSKEQKRHLARIEKQKIVMGDIAYTHSHEVSGQVATILGLVAVFNATDYADPDNKTVIDGISQTAHKLDVIVKDMIIKENLLNNEQR